MCARLIDDGKGKEGEKTGKQLAGNRNQNGIGKRKKVLERREWAEDLDFRGQKSVERSKKGGRSRRK